MKPWVPPGHLPLFISGGLLPCNLALWELPPEARARWVDRLPLRPCDVMPTGPTALLSGAVFSELSFIWARKSSVKGSGSTSSAEVPSVLEAHGEDFSVPECRKRSVSLREHHIY